MNRPFIILAPALAALLVFSAAAFAGEGGKKPATLSDVSENAKKTADSIADYTSAQKDEAVKKAREALESLDEQIDNLNEQIRDNWGTMDKKARENADKSLKELQRQRNRAAEWLGGLKESSAAAWEKVKKGFSDSLDELRDSFKKADEKLKSGKGMAI